MSQGYCSQCGGTVEYPLCNSCEAQVVQSPDPSIEALQELTNMLRSFAAAEGIEEGPDCRVETIVSDLRGYLTVARQTLNEKVYLLTQANNEIKALKEKVADRDANVSAVLENIATKYLRRVRGGGGLEDIYASLALSVAGLDSEVAAQTHDMSVLQDTNVMLMQKVAAAKRIISGKYMAWADAGGPNECAHGRADGIPCPTCDMNTLINPPAQETLSNRILNRPNGDPDDDLAMLARQLLRADERIALLTAQLAIMQAPIGPQDRWYVYWAGVKPNINDNTLTPPVTFEKGVNFILAERVKRAEKLANEENRNASKS